MLIACLTPDVSNSGGHECGLRIWRLLEEKREIAMAPFDARATLVTAEVQENPKAP
jgi:hypothetical protein